MIAWYAGLPPGFDTGSPMKQSHDSLLRGLATIEERFGERITLADIDLILITHGHTDHFGGLPFVRAQTDAPVGIHVLDRRILTHYEERVIVTAKQLATRSRGAGVRDALQALNILYVLVATGAAKRDDRHADTRLHFNIKR